MGLGYVRLGLARLLSGCFVLTDTVFSHQNAASVTNGNAHASRTQFEQRQN